MPYPSVGCRTCKIRRVKCDGAKPNCQRCLKAVRNCLWDDQFHDGGFSMHNENAFASGHVKRPRGPRSTWREMSPSREKQARAVATTVARPLFDLRTRAVVIYLHHYLQAPADLPGSQPDGFADCVYRWGLNIGQSPIIDLAISSMALATYSHTQNYPAAATEASLHYVQLLRTAQTTISTLNEQNVDVCLLAIFLMSRYESAVHESVDCSGAKYKSLQASFSHHDGAMTILRIWRSRFSGKERPVSDIIKYTRRGLLRSAILRHRALPTWIMNGSHFGEYGLELKYDRLVVRLINLRPELSRLIEQSRARQAPKDIHTVLSRVRALNTEAGEISDAMQAWTSHVPERWNYQVHDICKTRSSKLGKHFYSSIVYSYQDTACAVCWSQYLATRMLLCSTQLNIIKFLQDRSPMGDFAAYEEQLTETTSVMTSLADSLASTIPFCLQQIKVNDSNLNNASSMDSHHTITLQLGQETKPWCAALLVWPLTIASSLKHGLDPRQKMWFGSELAHAGHVLGHRVFSHATEPAWQEL